MNKHEYFIDRLSVRLAEAAEDEIIRACFITGNITDQVKPDVEWAKTTLKTANEVTEEELTIDNATQYLMLLGDMLLVKLRQDLRKELRSVGENYTIPAGAIDGKVMFAIQSAKNDMQAHDMINTNR